MPQSLPVIAYLTHVKVLGGGERSLWDLMCGIAEQKEYQPILFAPKQSALYVKARKAGIITQSFSFGWIVPRVGRRLNILLLPFYLLDLIPQAFKLMVLSRRYGVRILHSNSIKSHFLSVVLKPLGVSVIWHMRDILPKGPGRFLLAALARVIPSQIICISGAVASQFNKSSKVTVIYNGIDFPVIQKISKSKTSLPRGRKILTCVGQIAHWKGQDIFVEAFKILKDRGHKLLGVVVGGVLFPEREADFGTRLQDQIKSLGLQKDVLWVGHRDPVYPWMAAAHLLIHSNREPEPFGRVLVEALGLGIPVLTNTTTAYRELLPPVFWKKLPQPGSAMALADQIEYYLKNPRQAQVLARTGKQFVQRMFSIERTVARVAEVYHKLCA